MLHLLKQRVATFTAINMQVPDWILGVPVKMVFAKPTAIPIQLGGMQFNFKFKNTFHAGPALDLGSTFSPTSCQAIGPFRPEG
jgi:hypothetical protein